MLYFKCRLGDIKPYTIGRCRDLKPATMPTLILKSAYFFMHNQTPTFKKIYSLQYVMVRKFIKTYLLILNIKCFQNPLQGTVSI